MSSDRLRGLNKELRSAVGWREELSGQEEKLLKKLNDLDSAAASEGKEICRDWRGNPALMVVWANQLTREIRARLYLGDVKQVLLPYGPITVLEGNECHVWLSEMGYSAEHVAPISIYSFSQLLNRIEVSALVGPKKS